MFDTLWNEPHENVSEARHPADTLEAKTIRATGFPALRLFLKRMESRQLCFELRLDNEQAAPSDQVDRYRIVCAEEATDHLPDEGLHARYETDINTVESLLIALQMEVPN